MGNEVLAIAQIMMAQHAGDIATGIYVTSAPAFYAAVIFVIFLIVIGILIGIFKHFFVKDD